jgi:hypothetical protein
MIELDRATHTYSNGLPSVTQILKSVGLIDTSFYTEEGRQRGTAVHAACEYFDQGDLDESSIDLEIAGYLDAYKAWKAYIGLASSFDWIEVPVSDKAHLYAGTPDRVLTMRPRKLIDIKTGAFQRWHPIQAAAYIACLDDPFSYSRFGLYLQLNGKYSFREFPKVEFPRDLSIWQSALNIYYWKEK